MSENERLVRLKQAFGCLVSLVSHSLPGNFVSVRKVRGARTCSLLQSFSPRTSIAAEESRSIRDEIQRRLEAARDAEEDAEFDATFTHEENQERLELRESLERKKARLDPEARLDKLLAESTYSQPGALVELELAMEEAHVGPVLPVPAAPGAESYSERVKETFRELQDVELDRARDAAQRTKGRLTAEEGEEDDEDDEAALATEARAQIEGPEGEQDSVKRLERLEKKIMDLKWERVVKEDREASKAFQLLGVTYGEGHPSTVPFAATSFRRWTRDGGQYGRLCSREVRDALEAKSNGVRRNFRRILQLHRFDIT